jgi:hypothetical protein
MPAPSDTLPRRQSRLAGFASNAAGFLIIATFAISFFPYTVYLVYTGLRDRRRFRRKLAHEGRLMTWRTVRELLISGKGMLIVELWPKKGFGATWWIDPVRLAEHPACPLPNITEFGTEEFDRKLEDPTLAKWCYEHLIPLLDGASFVDVRPTKWRNWNAALPAERVRTGWPETAFRSDSLPSIESTQGDKGDIRPY